MIHRRTPILNLIDNFFLSKQYDKARNAEKKMNPNNFVAHYTLHTLLYLVSFFLISLVFVIFFQKFNTYLTVIPCICAVGLLLIIIHYGTYRCNVNKEGITCQFLGFIKKHISWSDIRRVESFTDTCATRDFERTLIFRNSKNKIIFTCTYELAGFNLIIENINEHKITMKRRFGNFYSK